MRIKDIVEQIGGKLLNGDMDLICENFSRDTRCINEGDIYIALKGETFDGNLFWKEAFENGASAVIIEEQVELQKEDIEKYKNKTIIQVENTMKSLHAIAKYKRSLYNIPVIAITGSVGKTSTKDIIANVVSQKYKTLKTLGNNNNEIGLPFTILRLKDEEAIVLEMGMNHSGEISRLTDIAKPTLCVITNIGTSHIGNLGSRENILNAKLEILEGCKEKNIIINIDNDMLKKWYDENKGKYNVKAYGISEKSDIIAKDIQLEAERSEFKCIINGKEEFIKVPVGGEHFVLNSLCACLVGEFLGIDSEKIKEGIEKFELTKKRMDIQELPNGIKIINDAYNASLESMTASLKTLGEFKNNRKIAVLGDMFELGKYAEELHLKVGEEVAKNNIDFLICSGKEAINIFKGAEKCGMKKEKIYYEDKENVIKLLKDIANKGDVILFKASNGMKFYNLAEEAKKVLEKNP